MTEIIALGSSRQPHYGSEHRESFPNVQKKLIGPPQLLIPRVPPVLLRQGLVWGPPGTFSPDCLESPTPGACASGASVVLADWIWSRGQLKNLRAIPLEMTLLATVITSPSLFTWVPLSIFPQAISKQIQQPLSGLQSIGCRFSLFFPPLASSHSLP